MTEFEMRDKFHRIWEYWQRIGIEGWRDEEECFQFFVEGGWTPGAKYYRPNQSKPLGPDNVAFEARQNDRSALLWEIARWKFKYRLASATPDGVERLLRQFKIE